jgi:hypothetical protein
MDVPHTGHLNRLLNQMPTGIEKMKARMANTIEYKSPDVSAAANINPKPPNNAVITDSRARVRSVISHLNRIARRHEIAVTVHLIIDDSSQRAFDITHVRTRGGPVTVIRSSRRCCRIWSGAIAVQTVTEITVSHLGGQSSSVTASCRGFLNVREARLWNAY